MFCMFLSNSNYVKTYESYQLKIIFEWLDRAASAVSHFWGINSKFHTFLSLVIGY